MTREATGIDVEVCDFCDYDIQKSESYDVIVMRHVLEHLSDPLRAMKNVYRLLKYGGHAVLEFPNTDSLDLRLKWFLRRNNFYRSKFSAEYVPHHCHEFCKEAFEFLLAKTGFELVRWQTYSSKEVLNPLYNIFNFGNKVRTLIKKSMHISKSHWNGNKTVSC